GPDQVVSVGQTVQLDGSGSFDPNGTIVQYSWTYAGSVPSGIQLTIQDPSAVKPTVVISQGGTFTFQLVVTDNHGAVSQPAQVHVRTGPIANAGASQTVNVGQTVQLDGSGSSDPSGLALTFHWTLTAPAGSSARLSDPTAAKPTFTADVAGDYTASLTVNNGIAASAPASVVITAIPVSPPPSMTCGDIMSGSITAAGQVDRYTFTGTANGIVTLTLADTGGFGFGIDAVANVFAPSGKPVVGFGANGQQQLTLAETGTYVVQVQANNLASTGTYNLGLVCRSPMVQPSTGMSCGSLPQGSITAAAQVNQYTFAGTANGIVTLTLADTGGFGFGIDAVANVFAPSGKPVVGFGANGQQQLTLAETGTYVVQVQANNLASSGTYSLGLVCTVSALRIGPRTEASGRVPRGTGVDIRINAVFDGDGYSDYAVWRPSNGT
ncbi:MAG TPA: PKD domain-containing protein, partial [Bryobacteraceae bacterium]|nr:PKD domain-containing protein [Bryobacteraceae bacterium]